jgi:CHAD domain-containing protein
MAFRLHPSESIPAGLRRLARKELRSITEHLDGATPPREDAIHEARKSVKKVRALAQVVEADKGRGTGKSAKRLQAVNRRLSGLRDADAMLEILNKLRSHERRILDEHAFARVRRSLLSHKRSVMKTANHKREWRQVLKRVRRIRRDARHWKPAHRRFGTLAAGIRVAYRRGRKAMARAQQRQRAVDFHEWRKEMKALWYELRLLEESSPRIRRDVSALHRAETWLGDEHNVVVLCAELSKDGSLCDGKIDVDRVRLAGDRYQSELRTKALESAKRVYARTPRNYVNAIRRQWKMGAGRQSQRHRTSR